MSARAWGVNKWTAFGCSSTHAWDLIWCFCECLWVKTLSLFWSLLYFQQDQAGINYQTPLAEPTGTPRITWRLVRTVDYMWTLFRTMKFCTSGHGELRLIRLCWKRLGQRRGLSTPPEPKTFMPPIPRRRVGTPTMLLDEWFGFRRCLRSLHGSRRTVASLAMEHWGTCPPRVLEIMCIM